MRHDHHRTPNAIVPVELENAVLDVFGIDHPRVDAEFFGNGAGHAFANDAVGYQAPTSWKGHALTPAMRSAIEARARPVVELALLARLGP